MNRAPTAQPMRRTRRGVAMLLVIMAVMMATILTTAYLASRDNSAAIGENVSSAAAARWAAMSGVQMGVAVMETEEDWTEDGGILLNHVDLAGADVTVQVVDMETGAAPTDKAQHLWMTSTAVVDGVTQVATASAQIMPTSNRADVDLSEFALFAQDAIVIDSSGTVTLWPQSPLAKLGAPINIGTQSIAPRSIQIKDSAAAINSKVLKRPTAPVSVAEASSGPNVRVVTMPDPIPLPAPPDSGVALPNRLLPPADGTLTGTTTLTADKRYRRLVLDTNSTTRLQGTMNFIADGQMEIKQGAKLVVDGTVKIVAFDELKLDRSAIEVTPGSRLEMFVRGGFLASDSYVGEQRADSLLRVDGSAPKTSSLEKVMMWGIAPALNTTAKPWYVDGQSVVMGSLYNPYAEFQIRNNAALYGRVAAKAIRVTSNATIFYDPALNTQEGFATLTSPIYDESGRMRTGFSSLSSLSSTNLTLLSATTGTALSTADRLIGSLLDPGPTAVPVSQPTPRTVPVEFTLQSFGSETSPWEEAN